MHPSQTHPGPGIRVLAGAGDEAGADTPAPEPFATRVRDAVKRDVVPLVEAAERASRFPREAVARLGARGFFRERWADPNGGLGAELAEELGRAGTGGVGLGITVHVEAALSILLRYGSSPLVRRVSDRCLNGEAIVALAASEASGSDMAGVTTTIEPDGDGVHVRGVKHYVSLGAAADHLLVLGRNGTGGRPTLVLMPREDTRVERRLPMTGVRSLETVRVAIDGHVPRAAVVGPPGAGALALTWGLTHERLATAAVSIGTATLAVGLATAELLDRSVRGEPLMTRQRPRLLLAEHAAQVDVLRRALHSLAAADRGPSWTRAVAGLKVVAARSVEGVLSDCMHLFGGAGYVEDETPLARLWRDVRAARIGGGTDEMMWELVAGGLVPARAAHDAMVNAR